MNVAHAGGMQERSGLDRLRTGMLLFLLSETFLFGNLFLTYYYLRAKSPVWPPPGVALELPLIAVNTVVLLCSSAVMQLAVNSARRGNRGATCRALVVTLLLGALFLTIKGWEWTQAGFRPWDHAYGSIFFTLTGFHGLHVLAGMVLLAALTVRTARAPSVAPLPIEVGGLYWHFVDFIWIFVFTTLYIIH
ncbi:MAG: cytochrome c oxidase subunit 3 [Dehalococcoidia bacterium]|nr:cytochrome c oxidase subunit 3 [Dehalococcoidia bacterium]